GHPTRIAHVAAHRARTWASGDIVLSDKPRALTARCAFFLPCPSKQAWGHPTRIAHVAAHRARTWASGDIVLSDKPRALTARCAFFLPCPSKQAWGRARKKPRTFVRGFL
ncbi:hypothetical protein N9W65_03860, partial [Schleiferiaceae bacterium]|nr:hypothetical protein [Schleiferiaceae bacterium]